MVNTDILALFYNSVSCCVWTYCVIFGAGNTDKSTIEALDRVTRRVEHIMGSKLTSVDVAYKERVCVKLRAISNNSSYPLNNYIGRLRSLEDDTNRYANSFVRQDKRHFNSDFKR